MKQFLILLPIILSFLSGCNMDNFLFNSKKIDRYQLPGNSIPDSLIKQVTFNSSGNILYGYWISSSGKHKGITILYCHGNKQSIDNYWDRLQYLHQLGVNVFIFDYRGFGLSQGESSEEGLHQDGIAALNFVKANYPGAADTLCFYGYSLGNVVSIFLAAEVSAPYRLIAEAPFASANSLTQGSLILDIPSGWLTKGNFDNANEIKKINTPYLQLHGKEDDFVRYIDNGKIVFDNAPQPKTLILVPNAVHTNIPETIGLQSYLINIKTFLNLD